MDRLNSYIVKLLLTQFGVQEHQITVLAADPIGGALDI
jgi:hypothetical protein